MSLPKIILASTSIFRQQLLKKLSLPFETAASHVDETPISGETTEALVMRLAKAKAQAAASNNPDAWIIGSDQACTVAGLPVGKPGSMEQACQQLRAMSGQKITFQTGLCLLNAATGESQLLCEPFHVYFRQLTDAQIENYVAIEQPLQCAGSFMVEALGITLFEKLEGRDPNALIGLPLIGLTDMLAHWGLLLPLKPQQPESDIN